MRCWRLVSSLLVMSGRNAKWMVSGKLSKWCGFQDLGFSGLSYAWDNRQDGIYNIKVRLDRGLANEDFLDIFPDRTVWHVRTTESDHWCLLTECHQ